MIDHKSPLWQQSLRLAAHHLLKWYLLFFIAGFVFDVFATRAGVDHTLLIVQQIVYLAVIGAILYGDFVQDAQREALPMQRWIQWLWQYRSHGVDTSLNVYPQTPVADRLPGLEQLSAFVN